MKKQTKILSCVKFIIINISHCLPQEIARGKDAGNDDAITLDVHSINKLQKDFNLEPTNESPKYNYTSDTEGNYGIISNF